MQKKEIAVIGGGAAGMMAAITAAGASADNHVTIYEGNDRIGKKLLATGNGKCNFSNIYMDASCFHGSGKEMAEKLIKEFGSEETAAFFQGLGMLVRDKNGYLYPASEQASTVLDVLRMQIRDLQITVKTQAKVRNIKHLKTEAAFLVETQDKAYRANRVILAAGGKAAPKTGSDGSGFLLAKQLGHRIYDCVPALVQLRCGQDYMKAIAGVRCDAQVSLKIDGRTAGEERGELQFTDYGVSGIVIFQLSRTAAYACQKKQKVQVTVDLLPDFDKQAVEALKAQRKLLFSERTAEEFFTGIVHKKLMLQMLKLSGILAGQPAGEIPETKMNRFFELCKAWEFTVTGTNSYEQAQVCAGGIDIKEVSEKLESQKVPGLYFAGEILDVDGKCGGYNLQWAWTSGYIAGKHAGENK